MRRYVTPMVRARAIASGKLQPTSKKCRQVAERMVRLSYAMILDLELAEAPHHVFRWVAWGDNMSTQRRRVDLVLLLRRSIERRMNGWLEERHLTAAMAVLEAARNEARRRGGIMPDPTGIALDAYRAAIEGATKNKGSRTPEGARAAGAATKSLTDEALVLDDEHEEEAEEEEEDAVAGEDDDAPASERVPVTRGQVLRHLSDAVRAALAARDVAAAEAINDTIALLCVESDAG